jgi:hypothetical protein
MKRALALLALATASATTLAAPVSYDFTGTLDSALLFSTNPGFPATIDPNTSLTVDGTQFLNGNPYVVGTITFDPDYQASSHLPAPITFSVSFEGFTVTRTQALFFTGNDQLNWSATGLQTHVEAELSTNGAVSPDRAEIALNFDSGNFTGGSFNFADVSGAGGVFSGDFKGTIDSAVPVSVPEPSELALLAAGLVAMLALSTRRRPLARRRV